MFLLFIITLSSSSITSILNFCNSSLISEILSLSFILSLFTPVKHPPCFKEEKQNNIGPKSIQFLILQVVYPLFNSSNNSI